MKISLECSGQRSIEVNKDGALILVTIQEPNGTGPVVRLTRAEAKAFVAAIVEYVTMK